MVISNDIALHVRDAQFGKLVEPTHPNDEDLDGIMTGSADEHEPTIDDLPTAAVPDDEGLLLFLVEVSLLTLMMMMLLL